MIVKNSLMRSVAVGSLFAVALGATAQAAPAKHHHPMHHRHVAVVHDSGLSQEVAELRAEVQNLKGALAQQAASSQQVAAAAQAAQDQAAAARAQVSAEADDIRRIPAEVKETVQASMPVMKNDKIYYRGVSITLGGFAAAESVYRSHNEEADIGSSYSAIPYPGPSSAHLGHTQEFRETARQSRYSALVEGNPDATTKLSFYGEFDFLGAAQTANSNESNSFTPRIRHLYGTVDWGDGWHFLAGQNWSLVTLNSKGISPRNEVIPATIEAQYVPGFNWARQPQLRLTKNFGDDVWIAVSAENPQTTFGGTAALNSGVAVFNSAATGSLFNSANTMSINHMPDFVAKVAFEPSMGNHAIHLEAFGLWRNFYDRVETSGAWANDNSYGGGFGGSITAKAIPNVLDLQITGMTGKGIGRYGSGQLPDTYIKADGTLEGIKETTWLAGGTLHATSALDVYVYGGQETDNNAAYKTGVAFGGYGNPNFVNTGCFSELSGATCVGNTRQITQETVGLWDKLYNGKFGSFRFGLQYSHTEREAFTGVGGSPKGTEDMVFTSFRYYPF
jgi:outer membrane murein-binding lipoprotein Lpp